jgi:formate--tetrahydrofolate ligase
VLVATIRALKYQAGVARDKLGEENLVALEAGLPNLLRHLENLTQVYGLSTVVAINRFEQDTDAEIALVRAKCADLGANVALSEVHGKGGEGGVELAEEVVRLCEEKSDFRFAYEDGLGLAEKIEAVATKVYHADGVNFAAAAKKEIARLEELGFGRMPVCIAKTQYSFTDDQSVLGAPVGFDLNVRNVRVSAGAGFVVALTGNIMTMPGLPKVPAAERIDVDNKGVISGLF